jgi:P-type E1-E2 ATPase
MFAAFFAAITGDIQDSVFIVIIITINTIIGTSQEYKAEKSSESLQSMLKIHTSVLRNNHIKKIISEELVPGDIVILESGDKVPADIYLIQENDLNIDESLLTGESVAIKKEVGVYSEDKDLADRKNMLFAGSTVVFRQSCRGNC